MLLIPLPSLHKRGFVVYIYTFAFSLCLLLLNTEFGRAKLSVRLFSKSKWAAKVPLRSQILAWNKAQMKRSLKKNNNPPGSNMMA